MERPHGRSGLRYPGGVGTVPMRAKAHGGHSGKVWLE